MNIPDLTSTSYNREVCVKKHFPEFYKFMMDTYPSELPWKEKVYWYLHGLTSHPVCKSCGRPTKYVNPQYGYSEYCSAKCSNSDPSKQALAKETCLERYGGVAPATSKEVKDKMQVTCLERYGVKNTMQNEELKNKSLQTNIERYGGQGNASESNLKKYHDTCLERYGTKNPMQNKQVQERLYNSNLEKHGYKTPFGDPKIQADILKGIKSKYGVNYYSQTEEYQEKTRKTNNLKYGADYYSQTEKYKEQVKRTSLERYGAENYSQTDKYKSKSYETKKRNHTFNSSKIEQEFKQWLDSNNISYEYQYRSTEYPHCCDFYFPDQKLFFEIQGSWVHGFHPYNQDTEEDKNTLSEWKSKNTKFYDNAIETWTLRDPEKRAWAKEHNLNWTEVFSNNLDEVIQHYNEHARVRTTE